MNKIKGVIEMFKELSQETLQMIRYGLLGFLVLDIFGFYWYLEWKQLGIALFLVVTIFLTIILLLERRYDNMEQTEKEIEIEKLEKKLKELKGEDKKPTTEEKEDAQSSMGLGLPSAEEFQKRSEEALGGDMFN